MSCVIFSRVILTCVIRTGNRFILVIFFDVKYKKYISFCTKPKLTIIYLLKGVLITKSESFFFYFDLRNPG